MTIEELISRYGEIAVFLGSGFEGETAAFLGGVASRHGGLSLPITIAAAICGSFLADQIFFFLGRYARSWRRVDEILHAAPVRKVMFLLEQYPTGFVLAFRFLYGLRTISPVVIGTSAISTPRFALLNAVAAIVWGTLITTSGYYFGAVIHTLVGRLPLHKHLLIGLAGAAFLVAAGLVLRKIVGRRVLQADVALEKVRDRIE